MIIMPNLTNIMITESKIKTMTELFTTTISSELLALEDPDMVFNDGHRLKIIVYR